METMVGGVSLGAFAAACAVTLLAGTVKGAIGFALPLIMIATLPSFMPPQVALAALILPVLATNFHQALRQGRAEAVLTARKFWKLVAATALMIALSAPLAVILSERVLVLLLGSAVLLFSALQASGWRPEIPPHRQTLAEVVTGLVGGFYGGIAGVWGPPLIVYLLAARVEKREMVRVLSVVFTLGGVVLLASHVATGILNRSTVVLSALLLIPAMTGMWIGYRIQDRLDPELFRKLTLIMLSLGALNLLRRGLMG